MRTVSWDKHMEEDLGGRDPSLEIQNITASSCWLYKARAISGQKKTIWGLNNLGFLLEKIKVKREGNKHNLWLWNSHGSQLQKHLTKAWEYSQTTPISPPLDSAFQSFSKINFFGILPSFFVPSAISTHSQLYYYSPNWFCPPVFHKDMGKLCAPSCISLTTSS